MQIIWLDWRCHLENLESEVEKILSANDLGDTNSHQAGFLVPHKIVRAGFFPTLEDKTRNPRRKIILIELEGKLQHEVNYIKYNNKVFGGTRYEYRITGVIGLFRHNLLRAGDSIVFKPINKHIFGVSFTHRDRKLSGSAIESWIIKGVSDGSK